jgi:hypothetical protein
MGVLLISRLEVRVCDRVEVESSTLFFIYPGTNSPLNGVLILSVVGIGMGYIRVVTTGIFEVLATVMGKNSEGWQPRLPALNPPASHATTRTQPDMKYAQPASRLAL